VLDDARGLGREFLEQGFVFCCERIFAVRIHIDDATLATNSQDEVVDPSLRPAIRAQIRGQLPVSPRTLEAVQAAMLADTEDADGSGRFARVEGFRVCAKTGTAQMEDRSGRVYDHMTWFASYAPYEDPRYAVVVMVQSGKSGGDTCAPVAKGIYEALKKREKKLGPAVAKN
jgi:cell division protein FtsI/penicillin-binding protein 2